MKYIWFWHPSILGTSLTSLPDLRICFLVGGATSTWWTGFGGDLSRRRKGWCVGGGYPVFFGKGRQPDLTPPPLPKKSTRNPQKLRGLFFWGVIMNHWFPMVSLKRRPFWSLISEGTLGKCPTHGAWMMAKIFCDPNNLRLGKTSPNGGGQNAFHLGFGIYWVLCPNDRFPISWFLPGCDTRWKKLIDFRFTNPPHLSFCLVCVFFLLSIQIKGG